MRACLTGRVRGRPRLIDDAQIQRVLAKTLERPTDGSSHWSVRRVALLELARRADYVSLTIPLTESTRRPIGAEFLREMRHAAYTISTARGGVIDQDALAAALREGWIGGAGLDVFVPERLEPDDSLLEFQNVIATPHVAYYSEESLVDLGRLAAENVARCSEAADRRQWST